LTEPRDECGDDKNQKGNVLKQHPSSPHGLHTHHAAKPFRRQRLRRRNLSQLIESEVRNRRECQTPPPRQPGKRFYDLLET